MLRRPLVVAAAGVLLVLGVACSTGRTPDSDFVRNAFGTQAILLDKVYAGGGSSENSTRTVVLRTSQEPRQVLATLSGKAGWRPVGEGIERTSDGLCVVAYASEDYRRGHPERQADVRAALAGAGPAVVLVPVVLLSRSTLAPTPWQPSVL